eukprot:scaffold183031_cov45-Prasinocladus_malaysianus.AAC.1
MRQEDDLTKSMWRTLASIASGCLAYDDLRRQSILDVELVERFSYCACQQAAAPLEYSRIIS